MTTGMIILLVYVLGALVTLILVKDWGNVWYEKLGAVSVWPATLLFFIFHKIHKGEL